MINSSSQNTGVFRKKKKKKKMFVESVCLTTIQKNEMPVSVIMPYSMISSVTQNSTKMICIICQWGRNNFFACNMISAKKYQNSNECLYVCLFGRVKRRFQHYMSYHDGVWL